MIKQKNNKNTVKTLTNRMIRDNIEITRKTKGVEAMLEKILILVISAAALLIVCWILTEYWLRSVRKLSVERISSLGILDRMAFAFEDFCGGVNHKKDFRKMRVQEELGSLPMEDKMTPHRMTVLDKEEKGKETRFVKKERKYKIKANM